MRFKNQLVPGKRCLLVLFVVLLAGGVHAHAGIAVPGDSIGTEVINGKRFILYKVEPKETLYSISNKYNISVAELVQYNPEAESGLKIGAVLKLPVVASSSSSATTVGGKFHVVEKSETLYSISRQYNVTVAQLKEWNNLSADAISLGDRLRVSAPEGQASTQPKQNTTTTITNTATVSPNQQTAPLNDYSGKIVHTVESKETLFSIARMHDTSEEKIKEWNKLNSDNISVGQKLIVGTTQPLASRNDRPRMLRDTEEENKTKDYKYNNNPISITQIGDPSQEDLVSKSSGTTENVRKITELGMAMVIVDTVNTKKYLALHRTAPIGTIMQVHNEMNNLSVFVRVVGKLPATGDNDKVLIKLSPKAFEKLGAYNDKFPVRLTYVP